MLQVLDINEVKPNERGNVRLIDSETDSKRELEITDEIIEKYIYALNNFKTELRQLAIKNEADFYSFDISLPVVGAVGKVLSNS